LFENRAPGLQPWQILVVTVDNPTSTVLIKSIQHLGLCFLAHV